MSMRSVKLVTLAAVIMMTLVPLSVAAISDDTEATTDDYSDYYTKQLEKLPKAICDKIKIMTPSDTSIEVELEPTWFKEGTSTKEKTDSQINEAIKIAWTALRSDNDLNLTSWINFNIVPENCPCSPSYINPSKVTIPIYQYTFTNGVTAESAKAAVKLMVDSVEVDKTADRYTQVTQIHNWVVNNISYPTSEHMSDEFVRSVWNALCGDRTVVCEGYAKAFKAICDKNDIPCIIVTGEAKGKATDSPEGHMWNYVKMEDNKWYLVDTTWDDQATVNYTYMLAGSSTKGFNITVSESYNTTTLTEKGFVIPVLSDVAYNDPSQKYHVTFCDGKDGTSIKEEDVLINSKIAIPENPHKEKYRFEYWVYADDDKQWDFSTPVKKDTVLYAKWVATDKEVFDVTFNTNGVDTPIPSVQIEDGEKVQVPDTVLVKEGYKFNGWNTDANGKGVRFASGSQITVSSNFTLYAEWEPTEDQSPYKIDSTIESAGEFLNGEKIPGISNSVLTIAVITAIVSILAILIIAHKD